jgi:plastocyanin
MYRPLVAAAAAALTVLGLVAAPASATPEAATPRAAAEPRAAAAAQTLTWTGTDSTTEYGLEPTSAVAGQTTIVFENSAATGNTTGMPHTLTFDTSSPGYNHDVSLNILANPFDANNGRHEATVTLTPGKYRYYCTIPGHSTMAGEFTVTNGGGDSTPPTVNAQVTGTQNAGGDYVGSATVTINATDTGSGVDTVEYQLDGGAWTAYTAPVVVSAVGDHMLHYRATDVAGNASPEGMVSFSVVEEGGEEDTTPPTVTAEVSGEQDAEGNYVDSATVTVTATDADSGVELVEYEIDDTGFHPYTGPVTVTEPGDHTVQFRATDAAGNESETGSVPFRVVEGGEQDTTPPTVTAEVSGEQDESGSYIDTAVVTLSATDEGSGVASVEYKLDDGAWTAYTAPVTVNTAGMHMLHYRATDAAGNASPEGMAHFTVVEQDAAAPTVSATVVGEQDAEGNYVGSALVTLSAEDDGSGVDTVEYQLDGGPWTRYTQAVQVSAAGEHTLAYRATDLAGNTSTPGSASFTVVEDPNEDTVAPSVSAVVSGNQDANWSYLDTATVTISALDVDSGVASVEYKLDGGAWTAYTEPLSVGEGAHTVWYRATDKAGNVSAELSGSFTVVAANTDACPDSDTRATVIIGYENTFVTNVDTGDGCTINDLIAEDGEYATHNAFVKHVKQVTRNLVTSGVLLSTERDIIVRAATRSDIGTSAA